MRKATPWIAVMAAMSLSLAACSSDEGNGSAEATSAEASATAASETATEATSSATATSSAAEEGEESIVESEKKSTLADWEGEWESISAYFDDPEVKKGMEEHAKEEGETYEEARAEFDEDRGTDFAGIVIDGDTVAFVDKLEDLGSDSAKGVKYEQVKAYDVKTKEFEFTWFIYEAQGDAPYKYLALMPVHGEEHLVHFHMRYGNDIDEMLQKDDWFPVIIKKGSADIDMIKEELFAHEH